jgi:hypothetical protein
MFSIFPGRLRALFGLGALFLSGISSRVAALASEGTALERFLVGLSHFFGLALLIYALIQTVASVGLLFTQTGSGSSR